MRGVGFRFRPTVKFLIQVLQYMAAGGEDLSAATEVPGDLCFSDLYGPGKEPWNVFSGENEIWELHDSNKKKLKEKYVVTKLNKIGTKKVSRTAGAGCWDDQSIVKPVEYGGHVMGHMRTLTYEYCGSDAAASSKCYYYMHEYHLSQHSLEEVEVSSTNYVICRIIKNETKGCRIKHSKKRNCTASFSAQPLYDDQDWPVKKQNYGEENMIVSSSVKPVSQLVSCSSSVLEYLPVMKQYYGEENMIVSSSVKPVSQLASCSSSVLDDDQYLPVMKQYYGEENMIVSSFVKPVSELDDIKEYQEYNPGVIDHGYHFPNPVVLQESTSPVYDPNVCGFGQDAHNEEQPVASFCSDLSEFNFEDQGNCIASSSNSEFLDQIDFEEWNWEQCLIPEYMIAEGEKSILENQFCSY